MTRQIKVGNVLIGGTARISVQSMLSCPVHNIEQNIKQAKKLEETGCDIIRIAIPDPEATKTLIALKREISCPIVADIHFDHRLALLCVKAGADKIRINPGNIKGSENLRKVAAACGERGIPIRIGVNGGSIERSLIESCGGDRVKALVQSALSHIKILEDEGFYDMVISLKCSYVPDMIAAYKEISGLVDYPLHLGVTEAGTTIGGLCKSAVGIGSLLLMGIGDTIRVSLTGDVCDEVLAGIHILRACGYPTNGIELISCPTCGRTEIPLVEIAQNVEQRLQHIKKPIKVAVMGCIVNGPGEAQDADIGIAGGKNSAVLFKKGKKIRILKGDFTDEFIKEVEMLANELADE